MLKKKLLKKKSCIRLILLLVMLISVCIRCGSNGNFKVYQNSNYRIKIKYPKNWTLQENRDGAVVVFMAPREVPVDVFQENVNIVVQDLSGQVITLQQYTATAINQLTRVFKSVKILDSGPTYWGGKPAHKVEYIMQANVSLRLMHIWMIKGKKAYQFTFAADADRYDEYMETVQTMINSFQVN